LKLGFFPRNSPYPTSCRCLQSRVAFVARGTNTDGAYSDVDLFVSTLENPPEPVVEAEATNHAATDGDDVAVIYNHCSPSNASM
jgi:hypothetical protein